MLRFLAFYCVFIGAINASLRTCQEKRCTHYCMGNSQNGYTCACRDGFHLDSDGRTCLNDNECDEWKKEHECEYQCVREEESYRCECPPGMRELRDAAGMMHCTDVDECSEGKDNCDQICINEPGSYHCACEDGYFLIDGHICGEKTARRGPPRPDPSSLQSEAGMAEPSDPGREDSQTQQDEGPTPTEQPEVLGPSGPRGMPRHYDGSINVPPRSMVIVSMSLASSAFGIVLLFVVITTVILCRKRKHDMYSPEHAMMGEKGVPTGKQLYPRTTGDTQNDELYMDLQMMEPRKPEEKVHGPVVSCHQ